MSEGGSSDQAIARAIEELSRAAIFGAWSVALDAVVAAVGGSSGHICSLSPARGASIGVISGFPVGALKAFNKLKGADPGINPRAAAIYAARPSEIVVESEVPDSPFYRDYYQRYDAPFACWAKLDESEGDVTAVMIFRSNRFGPAAVDQHGRTLSRLLPHIKQALVAQADIARRIVDGSAQLWDEAGVAAFYCDGRLRVLAKSAHGARAIETGRLASLRSGRLRLASVEKHRKLTVAASNAANHFARDRRTAFAASSADGALSCRVVVAPTPDSWLRLPPSPEVLVLLLNLGAPSNLDALRAAGLTEAEVDIARRLMDSETTRAIAEARGARIATVQTQIKAMHAKLGVTHRAELIKVLRTLIS